MERAEVRRLVDWFLLKFENDDAPSRANVYSNCRWLRKWAAAHRIRLPSRAARTNIRQHMKYIDWLAATRDWLGGTHPSYAWTWQQQQPYPFSIIWAKLNGAKRRPPATGMRA